ncbi:type VI secretion system-associated FHA domain protein TagH [Algicella marina]|uniref:Type VI secretion system-associated FHA domain protein TagH n=1 Tax=Algicella marina TaxID=2683284 RepID=A0A6P1T4C3_9RHOB|nr:type VI secretion system-associated FHA domain protein TagH [Algicella marina]QHQ36543.1 type VI secretion system-associated FHA domain protein TagH [Algicella marina]
MSVTVRFQTTGTVPGTGAPVTMTGGALTIGRGPENDMVLPDPERLISKRHCALEDHGGSILVVDLSTNGTFLNYAKSPVGASPKPLKSGDILVLGTYELVVEITEDEPAAPMTPTPVRPQRNAPHSLPDDDDDFLDDILGRGSSPKGPGHVPANDPLDELLPPAAENKQEEDAPQFSGQHGDGVDDSFRPSNAIIPDDWEDDFQSTASQQERQVPLPEKGQVRTQPLPAATQMPPHVRPVSGDTDPLTAFFAMLGTDLAKIPEQELPATMARLGQIMRLSIIGMREILMTRSSIKSEFRMEQTQITSGHNNPLKFSVSPEQAIDAIVQPTQRGYLPPQEAVEEALNDIKAHEIAMITGMEAALNNLLSRLDPAAVVKKMEETGGSGGLLKNKKANYWEKYEQMYGELSDQAENDFQELFSKEFARAYQDQLDRLK